MRGGQRVVTGTRITLGKRKNRARQKQKLSFTLISISKISFWDTHSLPISIYSIRGASELLEEIEFAAKKGATTSLFNKLSALRMDFSNAGKKLYTADQKSKKPSERYLESEFALCNLVLQGGGVLGLAHVGFIAGLEAAGVRFAGLAGTSAGAIVATTLACARGASMRTACSDRLIQLLSEMPMDLFIDGPPGTRLAIKRMLAKRNLFTLPILFGIYSSLVRFTQRRGLNPGIAFENWLQTKFRVSVVR